MQCIDYMLKSNDPKFYRNLLERLAKAQRVLARCNKGSERWNKQHKNFLHHESNELATNLNVVAIGNLSMKGMLQSLHFGKVSLKIVGVCSLLFSL